MQCVQSEALDVVHQAQELVSKHPHFQGRSQLFKFDFVDGELVVDGRVPTFYLKQQLQHTVQQMSGVRRVDCRVVVQSSR